MFGKKAEEGKEENKDEAAAGGADDNKGGSGEQASVQEMPEGEYQLHVLIETGKYLQLGTDDQVDPFVKINWCSKDGSTSTKKGVTRTAVVKWDEHVFLDSGKMSKDEISNSTIEIHIMNHGFFKSEQIGYYKIATSSVYSLKSKVNDKQLHVFHNQPIAFTNPEAEDKAKITANLTLSMNVQGPGDEAVQLKIGTDKEAVKYKPWMPASVQKKYKQLSMKFIKAEYLPIMDLDLNPFADSSVGDPYIFINHMGTKLKTKTRAMFKDGENNWCKPVDFNQEVLLPIELPLANDKLTFLFYDWEATTKDELICGLHFSMKQIIKDADCSKNPKGPDGKPIITPKMRWLNLYGCNVDYSGVSNMANRSTKMCAEMDNDDNVASTFKGRVLVEYHIIDEKAPLMKVRDLVKTPEYEKRLESMTDLRYQMFAEIRSGICLPDSKEYKIQIAVGECKWTSDGPLQGPKQKMKNYNRWSWRVGGGKNGPFEWNERDDKLQGNFLSPHQHLQTFPYVQMYLLDPDNVPVCYWKGKVTDFMDPAAKPKWVQLIPDLAIGYVKKPHIAGMIQFRLFFHAVDEKQNNGQIRQNKIYEPKEIFKKDIPKRANPYKIRAYVYQAESLPPCDDSGASDPYISIWTPDSQEEVKTDVVEQTNNPIYYTALDFQFEFFELDDAPPIILNFFDTDEAGMFSLLGDDDDYIGRAIIFLPEIGDPNIPATRMVNVTENQNDLGDDLNSDRIPQPIWYPVKFSMNASWSEDNGAKVLVSFAMIDVHDAFTLEADAVQLDEMMKIPSEDNQQVMVPLQMPDLQIRPMQVEINVLGFRDLLSTGLLPIKKAYAKFSLKSLLPPAQGKAVADIFTQPGESGSDPNVRTTLKFEVRIPSEPFYTPRMTCMTYDKLYFGGMKQPILGTFTLRLGEILATGRKYDADTLQECQDLMKMLKDIVKAKRQMPGKTVLDIIQEKHREETARRQQQRLGLNEIEIAQIAVQQEKPDFSKMSVEERKEYDDLQKVKKERAEQKEKHLKKLADEKKQLEAEREAAQEKLSTSKEGAANYILPKYKYDERLKVDKEVDIPPENLFMEIGYNKTKDDKNKHYRRYYCDELEKVSEVMPASPFLMEPMYRMEQEGAGLFGGSDDSENNVAVKTGYFKGIVAVYSKELREEREAKIEAGLVSLESTIKEVYEAQMAPKKFEFNFKDLDNPKVVGAPYKDLKALCKECGMGQLKVDEFIQNYKYSKSLIKRMNENVKAKTKVYVIDGFNFAAKDLFSLSDPYLIVKCGKDKFDERKNYQEDTMEPKFHKCYEFNVNFPGSPVIAIEAYDYDLFFGDDLIGVTKLDLDDRFFNKEWCGIENKPIEYRDLTHQTSTLSQGVIKLWVEIDKMDSKKSSLPPMDITPEPEKEYEMRFIIWGTKDLEMMDLEGTSDAYFKSYVDDKDEHFTDTHWRCQTGEANFNWRNLIPVKSRKDQDYYQLKIQGWDKDIIASDDIIGEFTLDIFPIFEDAYLTGRTQFLTRKYWDDYLKQALIDRDYGDVNDIKWDSDKPTEECFWVPIRKLVQEEEYTQRTWQRKTSKGREETPQTTTQCCQSQKGVFSCRSILSLCSIK